MDWSLKPYQKSGEKSFINFSAAPVFQGLQSFTIDYCQVLKEGGGKGRTVITGIRHEESVKRSRREMAENSANKRYLHPIIDWSTDEVWEYIRKYDLPYCSLYDEGFRRIGCIMCPYQGIRGIRRDMERWPRYADAYRRACIRAFDKAKADGLWQEERETNWRNGDDMFRWWIGELSHPTVVPDCGSIPLFSEDDGDGVL